MNKNKWQSIGTVLGEDKDSIRIGEEWSVVLI